MLKFGGFSGPTPRSFSKWQDLHLVYFGLQARITMKSFNELNASYTVAISTKRAANARPYRARTQLTHLLMLSHLETNTNAGRLAKESLQAHFAFKSLLIHGYMQFAMIIAFRCALHRFLGRDIER